MARTSGRHEKASELARRAEQIAPRNERTQRILAILGDAHVEKNRPPKNINHDSAIAGLEGTLGESDGGHVFENISLAPAWLVHIRLNEILSYKDLDEAHAV